MDTKETNRGPARPARPGGKQPADPRRRRPAPGTAGKPAAKPASGSNRPAENRERKAAPRQNVRGRKAAPRQDTRRREEENRSRERRRTRPARVPQKRKRPAPAVVYTPPKPFNQGRVLLQLSILVAVVLALTMGMSIFFKVKVITVSGAEKYTAWDVRQASGIQEGDGLLTFGEPRACGRITAALPYVKTARIGIKLPDTVNIKIEEYDVVYAVKDQSESWWLITSEGQVVEKTDSATAGQYTKLVGFQLSLPTVGEKAEAAEAARPTEPEGDTGLTGPTVPVTVFARDRLETALKILGCLEENGVIGRVASVDVTDLNQMELWYGEQYQVKLGDTARLDYKIRCMASSIAQLGDYQAGELDVSFTIWPEEVGYTPFA